MKDFIFFILYFIVIFNAGIQVIYLPLLTGLTGNNFYLLGIPVNLALAIVTIFLVESERESPFF